MPILKFQRPKFGLCLLFLQVALAQAILAQAAEPKAVPESSSGAESATTKPGKPLEYDKMPLAELATLAKANDSYAQFELGSRFNYGRGMPKNIKEALRWLRRAAQGGQADAQRLLALKLYNGYEVPVDLDEALMWTRALAEGGDVPAQLALGNMYASGEGTERNLIRAYMWYDIAAASVEDKQDQAAIDADTEPPAEGKPPAQPDAKLTALKESRKNAAKRAADQRSKIGSLLLPEQEVEAQQLSSDWWLQQQGVVLEEKKPENSGTAKKRKKNH